MTSRGGGQIGGRCRAIGEPLERRLLLATFTVTSTADAGPGTLRQAILDANASPTPDTIDFNLPTGAAPKIAPQAELPHITGPTIVDGSTQPGYTPGRPVVELTGLR